MGTVRKLLALWFGLVLVMDVAYGYQINGMLERARLENLSSDPTCTEGRVIWNTTEDVAKVCNGSTWSELGSGSAAANNNLIDNGGAESATVPASWTTFDDGAVSTPVDGTGGSPAAITAMARTTTSGELIEKTGTFKMAKSAANAQGEGWAYDFSLKAKSQLFSQLVTLNFDYYMSSAAADSLVVYLYDKDNATLITPRFITCGGGSTPTLTAQTTTCHAQLAWMSTTADDYRLIFMVTTTGATAYNYFIDNIYTGQDLVATSSAVDGWKTYTPTGTWSTNTTYVGRKRRVGDTAEYQISVQLAGAPTSAVLKINQPSGETIDSAKVSDTSRGSFGQVVFYDNSAAGAARLLGEVSYDTTTTVAINLQDDAAASDFYEVQVNATTPVTFGASDRILISYSVPIAEWNTANTVGENAIEWACNSSTTDAADTTSFVNGFSPCSVTGDLTASRAKRIRWATTPQAGDATMCWIDVAGNNQWVPALGGTATSGGAIVAAYDATDDIGLGQLQMTATTTDYDFIFRRYRTGTSGWSGVSSAKWICSKTRPGLPIGFGAASSTNPGLLKAGTLTKGIVESSSGSVLSSNNIWTSAAQVSSGADCSAVNCTIDHVRGGMVVQDDVDYAGSTGTYTVTFQSSFWSSAPACTVVSNRGNDSSCNINGGVSTTGFSVHCWVSSSGAAQNSRFSFTCTGPRT